MAEAPQKPNEPDHSGNLDALAASEAAGVVDAIDRHRNKILATIAIAAIVLCAALITAQVRKQRHLAAASAFTSAAAKGEIAALDGVLVDFPGTVPAGNALLTKAELQIDQGKPADATATLERFLSEFESHPRYPQGLFAFANLHHQAGDAVKAKEFYEKVIAAQPDAELTPLARIRLGDLALEAGDTATADARYQESFTLHPGNPFFDYAEEKIALLKVGNPPEVDKPAPPAPVETPKSETPAPANPEAPKPDAAATPAAAPAPAKPEAPKAQTAAPAPAPAKPDAPKSQTPAPAPTAPAPAQ